MRACNRIDQLPCDANFPRRLPHRPPEDIAHAEPSPDFLDIDCSALEGEARIARDHEQRLEARQRGDNVFDDTVGKVLLFWNGSTAMEGLSGSASGTEAFAVAVTTAARSATTENARTGSSMFLTCCAPRSANANGRIFLT